MKGLVFIEDGEIGLRFAASTAFQSLASRYELHFALMKSGRGSPRIRERLERDGYRITEVPVHPGRSRRWQEAFSVSCLLHRSLSPSFEQRALGMDPKLRARTQRHATEAGYREFRDAFERAMGLHPELLALTVHERPDFFVIPSALLDLHTDDALQIADHFGIASLVLVAGWDNPSSKGLLYRYPTRIGAWGEQSKRHIVEIQRVPEERVAIVGAPHFELYRQPLSASRQELRAKWGVPVTGRVLVFAGTLRLFDETALLGELDAAIDRGELGEEVHVLYRPHPWRFQRTDEQDFTQVSFRHVTLDPTLAEVYRNGSGRPPTAAANFADRANDLHELYSLCDAVVTPMSSLLLESMINGLPVMAVAFGDGKHGWSADKVAKMLHFEELYRMPEVIVCRERERFFADLKALLARVGDQAHSARLRELSLHFHYQDACTYGERVAAVVDEMLATRAGPPRWDAVVRRPGRRYRVETWLRDGPVGWRVRYLTQRLSQLR